jgi:hypothetical protein
VIVFSASPENVTWMTSSAFRGSGAGLGEPCPPSPEPAEVMPATVRTRWSGALVHATWAVRIRRTAASHVKRPSSSSRSTREKLGKKSEERAAWHDLLVKFPNSVHAARAKERIARPLPRGRSCFHSVKIAKVMGRCEERHDAKDGACVEGCANSG